MTHRGIGRAAPQVAFVTFVAAVAAHCAAPPRARTLVRSVAPQTETTADAAHSRRDPQSNPPALELITAANASRLVDLTAGAQAIEHVVFAGPAHAIVVRRSVLTLVRIADGVPVRRIPRSAAWAADRSGRIAVWERRGDAGVFTLQALDGTVIRTFDAGPGRARTGAWFTRDGSRFVATLNDGNLHVFTTADGRDVGHAEAGNSMDPLHSSADGTSAITDLGSGSAGLLSVSATPVWHEVHVPFEQISDGLVTGRVAISADGTLGIVDYGEGRSFAVFDVATGRRVARGSRRTRELGGGVFSLDGQAVVTVASARIPALQIAPIPALAPATRVALPALRCVGAAATPTNGRCEYPIGVEWDSVRFRSATDFTLLGRATMDGNRPVLIVVRPTDAAAVSFDGTPSQDGNDADLGAATDDRRPFVRHTAEGTQLVALTGRAEDPLRVTPLAGMRAALVSDDGSLVAGWSGSSWGVWRSSDGQSLVRREGGRGVELPDGRSVDSFQLAPEHPLAVALREARRIAAPSTILAMVGAAELDTVHWTADDAVRTAFFGTLDARWGVADLPARNIVWQDRVPPDRRADSLDVRRLDGAVAPDASWVATRRGNGTLDLLDVRTGAVRATQAGGRPEGVVRVTPDGQSIISIDHEAALSSGVGLTVRAFDAPSLAPRWQSRCQARADFYGGEHVWIARDSSRLVVAGGDRLCVYDVRTGRQTLDATIANPGCGVVDTDRGQYAWGASGNDHMETRRVSLADGTALPTLACGASLNYESGRSSCSRGQASDPGVDFIAFAGHVGRVGICDATSGQALRELRAQHSHEISAVAVSPAGLVAAVDERTTLTLWDGRTGAIVGAWDDAGDRVAFAAGGALIVTWQSVWSGRPRDVAPHAIRAVIAATTP